MKPLAIGIVLVAGCGSGSTRSHTVSATVPGFTFTVELPGGMELETYAKGQPDVTIASSSHPSKTVEDVLGLVSDDEAEVVRKEVTLDGFFVVIRHRPHRDWVVIREAVRGLTSLVCDAGWHSEHELDDDAGAMLQAICASLRIQSP